VSRLLGKQPLDAVWDPELRSIYLACDVSFSAQGGPFSDLDKELRRDDVKAFRQNLDEQVLDAYRPADLRAALEVLTKEANAASTGCPESDDPLSGSAPQSADTGYEVAQGSPSLRDGTDNRVSRCAAGPAAVCPTLIEAACPGAPDHRRGELVDGERRATLHQEPMTSQGFRRLWRAAPLPRGGIGIPPTC
jgi:hypothetical protein